MAIGKSLEVSSPKKWELHELLERDAASLHHDPIGGRFNHHEYIVFRRSQAIPAFTVEFSGARPACS